MTEGMVRWCGVLQGIQDAIDKHFPELCGGIILADHIKIMTVEVRLDSVYVSLAQVNGGVSLMSITVPVGNIATLANKGKGK